MDAFKAMLLNISDKLSTANVQELVFLCGDKIGKKKLEKVQKGTDIFQCLMEITEIGPDNTELLRSYLNHIDRKDLLNILDTFENGIRSPVDLPDDGEQAQLDIATQVIVANLGRKWLTCGRKLGLGEAKLEHIQEKHPRNLEEQVRELIKEWRKMRKAEAKVNELIQALRNCNQNYTADLVVKELASTVQ